MATAIHHPGIEARSPLAKACYASGIAVLVTAISHYSIPFFTPICAGLSTGLFLGNYSISSHDYSQVQREHYFRLQELPFLHIGTLIAACTALFFSIRASFLLSCSLGISTSLVSDRVQTIHLMTEGQDLDLSF